VKFIQSITLAVFCVIFVSCVRWGSKENNRLMQQAQLLVEVMPDSALMLLNLVNMSLFSDSEEADYTLLRVQARDNAGHDLTTDIEILKTCEFFLKIGLNTVRFKRDFNDPVIFNTINSNIETLYKKGIFGTPTIVVGNRMYLNVHTEDELTKIIEKEIKNSR